VEEVSIFFRVKTQAEKAAEAAQDAGFAPTPNASDNEGENEADEEADADGDKNEEEKMAEPAADSQEEDNKEAKHASPTKAENPEEKIFDRIVKINPKTKLKGIRKAILEELGCEDMCTARLYSVKSNKASDENQKADSERPAEDNNEDD